MDIVQQADREIEAAADLSIGFLLPEGYLEAFVHAVGVASQGGPPETTYRDARFKRAPATEIVREERF